MSSSNAEYFARRSEQERVAAQAVSDPQIAAIHAEMAELYENAAKVAIGSPSLIRPGARLVQP